MQWATAVGLEKNITENREKRTDREKRTEKPITESPLITDWTAGWADQLACWNIHLLKQ